MLSTRFGMFVVSVARLHKAIEYVKLFACSRTRLHMLLNALALKRASRSCFNQVTGSAFTAQDVAFAFFPLGLGG